jgi:hypothetical protein
LGRATCAGGLLIAVILAITPFVGLAYTSSAAANPNVFIYNLDDLKPPAGFNTTRIVSQLDLLPTMLAAAVITLPAGSPVLDAELMLVAGTRTAMYSEYFLDSSNGNVPRQRMVRTPTATYIQKYDATGAVTPASEVTALRNRLNAFAGCARATGRAS